MSRHPRSDDREDMLFYRSTARHCGRRRSARWTKPRLRLVGNRLAPSQPCAVFGRRTWATRPMSRALEPDLRIPSGPAVQQHATTGRMQGDTRLGRYTVEKSLQRGSHPRRTLEPPPCKAVPDPDPSFEPDGLTFRRRMESQAIRVSGSKRADDKRRTHPAKSGANSGGGSRQLLSAHARGRVEKADRAQDASEGQLITPVQALTKSWSMAEYNASPRPNAPCCRHRNLWADRVSLDEFLAAGMRCHRAERRSATGIACQYTKF